MICKRHNRFFPTKKCPLCEEEERELLYEIALAELENSKPIVLWERDINF